MPFSHEVPSLPNRSPDPDARRAQLERARDEYRYDASYPGMLLVERLPLSEHFPPRYLAKGAEVTLALAANRAASAVGGWTDRQAASLRDAIRARLAAGATSAGQTGPGEAAVRSALELTKSAGEAPASGALAGWERMFATIAPPSSIPHWREDWCFAWQRLAGPSPVLLRGIDRLPEAIAIDDVGLARALGRERASVAAALAARRFFVADYAMFDGVRAGITDGAQKYLWAPLVLFCADPGVPGGLAPVAIQVAGSRGGPETLYRPGDADWLLARTAAQIADENLQGVLVHLGWCHMIIQRFILAARRQLASEHPLLQLLAPHFELTLAVNQVARESVTNPGGVQDRLLAPILDAQLSMLEASLREIDLDSLDPTIDFARRAVADRDALALYPFRDDSLPLWEATREFVGEYVRLYYQTDDDVRGDHELAAMVREIGAPEGGRLPRLVEGVSLATVDDVVSLVARVIFRATVYHAAINDSNFDWAGYVPGLPTAGFAPLPPRGTASESHLARMLPSVQLGWETITATYQVAQLHTNRLGEYPKDAFRDPRVAPLIERWNQRLREIETEIERRNASRPIPYQYLMPSRITASINA